MQLGQFVKRHKVLTASLCTTVYLGLTGYVVPALDTGHWDPRKQWEYSKQYTELYVQANTLADRNGDGIISDNEWEDLYTRMGTRDGLRPPMSALKKAVESYQSEGR